MAKRLVVIEVKGAFVQEIHGLPKCELHIIDHDLAAIGEADYSQEEIDVLADRIELQKYDLAEIARLQNEAEDCCETRGHRMRPWNLMWTAAGQIISEAHCTWCGADVMVKSRLQPNQIDIAGKAVAMNCPGREPW